MRQTPDPTITGLGDDDRHLLIAGLTSLREVRGLQWREACDHAAKIGAAEPPLLTYGIDDIKLLARRLGGEARHWTE
ncbi:hypothetical protein KZX46_21130 (plasmid) [Polymorphobacter sp. PAMC 29334]|uniref:hypothetical protein n=1 Tax=Polymorphobacter sp. PAMC 29334 TaxID=2862331 RepID=UPI001C798C1E|nr:hypothetical protein [Polymorphobacter sp. PAMC 29334]QYE37019.1 hypothetical protein KZX46_21130 [Polymorphobacter sp. PAMC 29334]